MPSPTTGGVAWRGSTCFVRARGVACYVRNNLSSTKRNFFPHDIETIFKEIFLPKNQAYESWYSLLNTLSNKVFRNNE